MTAARGRLDNRLVLLLAVACGAARPEALAAGFERGLLVAAALATVNLLVGAFSAPRVKPDAALVAEAMSG